MRQFLRSSSSQGPVVPSQGAITSLSSCLLLSCSGERSTILARFLPVGSDAPSRRAIDATGSPWPTSPVIPAPGSAGADGGRRGSACPDPKLFVLIAETLPRLNGAAAWSRAPLATCLACRRTWRPRCGSHVSSLERCPHHQMTSVHLQMDTNSPIVWAMKANASGFYVTATFAVRMRVLASDLFDHLASGDNRQSRSDEFSHCTGMWFDGLCHAR